MNLNIRMALILGAAVLAITAFGVTGYKIYNYGKETALEDVRKNNNKLGNAAEEGAIDYDACLARKRMWDWQHNRCGGNAPSGGN
jgi:hypothetical protein